jgi:AcrR family transcriptional regulator
MRPSCREKILDAAEAVARESGASRLTLDAAAERAGVSKGGVLYHFPTKEALLEAMVSRHLKGIVERRKQLESTMEGPGAELKAEVSGALTRDKEEKRMGAALLAAATNDPRLLGPALEFQKQRFQELAGRGADEAFARRAAVLLAVDGMLFLELLEIAPFTRRQREVLMETLTKMSAEAAEA